MIFLFEMIRTTIWENENYGKGSEEVPGAEG